MKRKNWASEQHGQSAEQWRAIGDHWAQIGRLVQSLACLAREHYNRRCQVAALVDGKFPPPPRDR